MKAHPLLLRAGVGATLVLALGAQAQVPRLGAGTAAGKPVNTQQAATFGLPRPGGLTPGIHDVTFVLRVRMSYIPEELQPSIWTATRKAVIVK